MEMVSALCTTDLLAEANQPVVCNIFTAVFVSLGGYAAGLGYVGRANVLLNGYNNSFSSVHNNDNDNQSIDVISLCSSESDDMNIPFPVEYVLLKRLLGRGRNHDEFWRQLYLDKWNLVQLEMDYASNVQKNKKNNGKAGGVVPLAPAVVTVDMSVTSAPSKSKSKLQSAEKVITKPSSTPPVTMSTSSTTSPLLQRCMNYPMVESNTLTVPEKCIPMSDIQSIKAEPGEYKPLTLATAPASVYPENYDPNLVRYFGSPCFVVSIQITYSTMKYMKVQRY